jgi:hypothetical protein
MGAGDVQAGGDSLNKIQTSEQPVKKHHLTTEHHTVNPIDGNGCSGSDMLPGSKTSLQAADLSAVVRDASAPVLADSSAPIENTIPIVQRTQPQAEASSQTRTLPSVNIEVNGSQEPYFNVPQEMESRSLEPQDAEVASLTFPCMYVREAGPHAKEVNPAVVDETAPRPAELPTIDQSAIATQPTILPTPDIMPSTAHATERTVAAPQLMEMLSPTEGQRTESPASYIVSALRSANAPLSGHGSAKLHDRKHGNNIGATSVEETEQEEEHMEIYSQSVPSELDAQLYSDDEEAPYQRNNTRSRDSTLNYHNSNTHHRVGAYNNSSMSNKVNNNQEKVYVDADDISPEVSTQCTLSKQSSSISDWLPANQEQAARMSLQESIFLEERLFFQGQKQHSQSVHARANASSTYTINNNNNNYHDNDYDLRGSSLQHRSRSRSRSIHLYGQEQGQGRVSLIRLPSDPEDMNALSPTLGSQDDYSYSPGPQFLGFGGAGGEMQRVWNACELGAVADDGEEEEEDALSEWIHDDEW